VRRSLVLCGVGSFLYVHVEDRQKIIKERKSWWMYPQARGEPPISCVVIIFLMY
jgi:hypothetical protein